MCTVLDFSFSAFHLKTRHWAYHTHTEGPRIKTGKNSWPETTEHAILCFIEYFKVQYYHCLCVFQSPSLPDFNTSRGSRYQPDRGQPCHHLWRFMESFSRCTVHLPCVPLWSDQTVLHLQVSGTGKIQWCAFQCFLLVVGVVWWNLPRLFFILYHQFRAWFYLQLNQKTQVVTSSCTICNHYNWFFLMYSFSMYLCVCACVHACVHCVCMCVCVCDSTEIYYWSCLYCSPPPLHVGEKT